METTREDEVRTRAYAIWEREGRPEGGGAGCLWRLPRSIKAAQPAAGRKTAPFCPYMGATRLPDREGAEMAGERNDQAAKEEVAEGMSEAGKDQVTGGETGRGQPGHGADPSKLVEGMAEAGRGEVKGGGDQAGKGQPGHGADPDKLIEGMSEAGSGAATGGEGDGAKGGGR
jgi:hypothetical protein